MDFIRIFNSGDLPKSELNLEVAICDRFIVKIVIK